MIGFLKTRGPVNENIGLDKTEAINLALKEKELRVDNYRNNTYFGIKLPYNKNKSDYNYYFTCSDDFREIEYVHIYDHGEGCEETILKICEKTKLTIIGKCILFDLVTIKS